MLRDFVICLIMFGKVHQSCYFVFECVRVCVCVCVHVCGVEVMDGQCPFEPLFIKKLK
jgi:hypothetical protein